MKRWHWTALLFAAAVFIYVFNLGSYGLFDPDEGRYAEIAREMNESGDWVTPRLNYVRYFEKPPLTYWIVAASQAALGESELAARLPIVACALLGAVAAGALGAYMYGSTAGILGGFITATSLLWFVIGRMCLTDMPLSLCITSALVFLYIGLESGRKRYLGLFYASMALGLLSKGLIAIVLPAGIGFWYALCTRRPRLLLTMLWWPGILLFFAIAVPYFWVVCDRNPEYFQFFFIQEHFLRYTTTLHKRYEPFWFFVPLIPLGLMPWTGFLAGLAGRGSVLRAPAGQEQRRANLFLLLWFGIIFVFFSLSKSKLVPYIVPCLPPLAVLVGANLARMLTERRWIGHGHTVTLGLCAFLFAAALSLPVLKEFGVLDYSNFGKPISAQQEAQAESRTVQTILMGFGALALGAAGLVALVRRTQNFRAAAGAFCLAAALFYVCLYDLWGVVAETRSLQHLSAILQEHDPNATPVWLSELMQGVGYYTHKRCIVVHNYDELAFGADDPGAEPWFFPTWKEFTEHWTTTDTSLALIAQTSFARYLFPPQDIAHSVEAGRFTILFNKKAPNDEPDK